MKRFRPYIKTTRTFINAKKYIRGLLGPAERKNGWQIAESEGAFIADSAGDEMRSFVAEKIGSVDGVIIAGDTGFAKKGTKSCGVKRQYSGTFGKIENCQVGVFLSYSSEKGHALIDRRLYIPKEWASSEERRKEAGVPEDLEFQTKPDLALDMIKQATQAGVPYTWVAADCAYGEATKIRSYLEENKKCYVLAISGKQHFWRDLKQVPLSKLLGKLPKRGWKEYSMGEGAKGERAYEWIDAGIDSHPNDGWEGKAIVRRSKSNKEDMSAYMCFAPKGTPMQKFVEIAGMRWTIETCFEEAKALAGLGHYEVRTHSAWYRHITLSCMAMALLRGCLVSS
ncbi:MAG: IS701 family transposase [Eubacteriaceae bacterium]|nr:IS701 family transposase [Eubacteriaceae bacterium]